MDIWLIKNPENRKAKRRETVMQLGNISIPIITVETFAKFGKKFGEASSGSFCNCRYIYMSLCSQYSYEQAR